MARTPRQFAHDTTQNRTQPTANLGNRLQTGNMVTSECGRGGNDNRNHNRLRHHRANSGVPSRRFYLTHRPFFVNYRALLVKNHPRHNYRPHIGG